MRKIILFSCILCMLLTGCHDIEATEDFEIPTVAETTVTTAVEEPLVDYTADLIFPVATNYVDKSTEVNYVQNGVPYAYSYEYYKGLGSDYETLYETMYKAMIEYTETIKVPANIKIGYIEANKMFFNMTMDNSELFFVSREINFTVDEDNNVTDISFSYVVPKENRDNIITSMGLVVDSIKAQLPENISQYDLMLYLHDFLIQNVVYDESYTCNSAVECLLYRRATCQGFADGYNYLLKQFGISSAMVGGEAGAPHIWNAVPYADGYVAVDVGMDNQDSAVSRTWNLHTMFGVTNEFLVNEAEHVVYDSTNEAYIVSPEVTLSGYSYYEIANNKNTISGTLYEAQTQLIELLSESVENGVYYVDVKSPDYSMYAGSLLNVEDGYLAEVISEVNNRTSVNLDIFKIGVSLQGWNDSFIIYVFER